MIRYLLAAVALATCTPTPPPHVDPPIDAGPHDGGPIPPPPAPRDCAKCVDPCDCACCVMASYNDFGPVMCPEALPTAKGESCRQVCYDATTFPGAGMPTACISKAQGIGQLKACGVCR